MEDQRGARWLARDHQEFGGADVHAQDVSSTGGSPTRDDPPAVRFALFECISECKIASSVAALRSLGFEVNGERGTASMKKSKSGKPGKGGKPC